MKKICAYLLSVSLIIASLGDFCAQKVYAAPVFCEEGGKYILTWCENTGAGHADMLKKLACEIDYDDESITILTIKSGKVRLTELESLKGILCVEKDCSLMLSEEPGTETPNTEAPNGEMPGTEAPSGETPNAEEPSGETPKSEAPNGEIPDTEEPNGEEPKAEAPSGETPDTETPNGEENVSGDTASEETVQPEEPERPERNIRPITNDYFSLSQYWLNNPGYYFHINQNGIYEKSATEGVDLDAIAGWREYFINRDGRVPVIVAVIDTGIDTTHPDLVNRMWTNTGEIPGNGIDDDGNGYIDDIHGWDFYNKDDTVCHYQYNESYNAYLSSPYDCDDHGTHVAGIINAEADNYIGITGVCASADVQLMSLKIHGGANRSGSLADALVAIKYAQKMGARICNLSWGTYTDSTSLYTVIKRSPMLFVCSAGNDGTNNDLKPLYPASFDLDNIISVTFVGADGKMNFDSNYGMTSVDIAAPAVDIFSTVVGSYAILSGSSMAAPQVTAIAALVMSYADGIYASEVKQVILRNGKYLGSLDGAIANPVIPSLYQTILDIENVRQDNEAPVMSISAEYAEENIVVKIDTADEGGSGLGTLAYLVGEKDAAEFGYGAFGTIISGDVATLSKSGKYTFFLTDNARNYITKTINIPDDNIGPVFERVGFEVNEDRTEVTIYGHASDSQSGLKNIKFLTGKRAGSEFKSRAHSVEFDENGDFSFTVEESGLYTLCAQDYRGNRTTAEIMTFIRRSTDVSFLYDENDAYDGGYDEWLGQIENGTEAEADEGTEAAMEEENAQSAQTGEVLSGDAQPGEVLPGDAQQGEVEPGDIQPGDTQTGNGQEEGQDPVQGASQDSGESTEQESKDPAENENGQEQPIVPEDGSEGEEELILQNIDDAPLGTEETSGEAAETAGEETELTKNSTIKPSCMFTVEAGSTLRLRYEMKPLRCTDTVVFTSSDTKIAVVDNSGIVFGFTEGTTLITVTTSNGYFDTCIVTVVPKNIEEEEPQSVG